MLKVENLSCQRGYNILFEQLSFCVKLGDILRITGTNGSGKTSLLKLLAGLSTPEYGTIKFHQHLLKSPAYQKQVLYLGHLPALSGELSVGENLRFLTGLTPTDQQTLPTSLAAIGLKGYEDERCAQLSAGQKRRVILAALFAVNAKLWLLDEPFTALDSKGIEIVEARISQHCAQGGLCIFTTHQDVTLPNQRLLAL